eukprot:16634-Heterococcus_DN1.PRE.1
MADDEELKARITVLRAKGWHESLRIKWPSKIWEVVDFELLHISASTVEGGVLVRILHDTVQNATWLADVIRVQQGVPPWHKKGDIK